MSGPREKLATQMAKLAALQAQAAATEVEHREASDRLYEAEAKLESLRAELEKCQPLSRKTVRKTIADLETDAADFKDYQTSLREKAKKISEDIVSTKGDIRYWFRLVVEAAPGIRDLVAKYKATQAELEKIGATLNHIGHGNLPRDLQNWYALPALRPIDPDPAWVHGLAELEKDAFAALPGGAVLVEDIAEAA